MKILILATFCVVYFYLGYTHGSNNSKKVIDIEEKIEYNLEDPNLDLYYDRDSGKGDSNYE